MSVAPKPQVVPSTPRDPDGLLPLVQECVGTGQSVLIFCATKDWCEKAAAFLADELPKLAHPGTGNTENIRVNRLRLLEELKQAPSGLCPTLGKTVLSGVAYHHAGLTVEERRCLCATSTLAAGVNLPARRVIIRSLKVGGENLDAGECIVMTRSSKDTEEAHALLEAQSSLTGQRLVRAVLEVVALGLVRTVDDLEGRFARSLLRFYEERPREANMMLCGTAEVPGAVLHDIREALSYLKAQKLVRVDDTSDPDRIALGSPLTGYAASSPGPKSALRPAEALNVFEDLQKARQGLCLDSDLHLIFLVTPATSIEPDWSRYISYYEKLQQRDRAVANAVGISPGFLLKQSMGHRGPLSSDQDWRQDRERITALHRRFWAALALRELVVETPPDRVAKAFAASRGSLQSLQSLAATYCGMVRQLCERLRWHEMAALFDCLMPRLNFGVSAEVLPLCRIPAVGAQDFSAAAQQLSPAFSQVYPVRARALFQVGLTSVQEVAKSSVVAIEAALRKLSQFESCRTDAELAQHQEAVTRQAAVKILHGAQQCMNDDLQQLEDEAEDERARIQRTT
eukprot:symbB.v1.2.022449.t1/scaffold1940.1/size95532/15